MSVDYYEEFYDDEEALEQFSHKKEKRKPKGKQSITQLTQKSASERERQFDDAGLQNLYDNGYLDALVSELKSGKEATVYLARDTAGQLMAAKLYRDLSVRSFKQDDVYTTGRFISKNRRKRVMTYAKKAGLEPALAFWVQHEYDQLWFLHEHGIPVPEPILSKNSSDVALVGRVVLMHYLGTEDAPAPRLSDANLSGEALEQAWHESVDILARLIKLERVHGDYSAYNLLWWASHVVVIDLPQMINMQENRHALNILKQDIESLCSSFLTLGLERDPDTLFASLLQDPEVEHVLRPLMMQRR